MKQRKTKKKADNKDVQLTERCTATNFFLNFFIIMMHIRCK